MFLPTLKEVPAEAEVVSHKLMLRAGMIRKLAAGIYSFLPFGYRAVRKVENIVREEMDRSGAQEVFLPAMNPAEIWMESGRWDVYGKELIRLKDRMNRDFCLGPTHEEVITDIIRKEVRSYRDLPLNLYQIQTKFRDEIRPRFGIMRGREFLMKDAYSFDVDDKAAEVSYRAMYEAYMRIFARCGLEFIAAEAESGPIGGSYSHEFMVLAQSGESEVVRCPECGYASNVEKARVGWKGGDDGHPAPAEPLERVLTVEMKTVQEVAGFLGREPSELVKTLLYLADGEPVAALVRGDHKLNEAKLSHLLGSQEMVMADECLIQKVTGAPEGFSGPVGLDDVRIVADNAVRCMSNFVVGANQRDHHYVNANLGRDFKVETFADLRMVQPGDLCPECGGTLQFFMGIEVGHVFKLGTKYSESMRATYLDSTGNERYIVMGCYGIGIGRTVAAAIEQDHDENGIIWPMPIAPYHALVLPVTMKEQGVRDEAEAIYRDLSSRGVETILDDRDERPGVKFKDADLLGIPIRITLGPKNLRSGQVEIRTRRDGETRLVAKEEAAAAVAGMVSHELKRYESGAPV